MSNFNIGGSGDLTDGTANISVATISISSLTPSTTMKSDLSSKIISSALDISDVSGLQSELDATIQNPFVGTLQATDFESDNVASYDVTVQALVASDSTKLSKTDTADQEFVSNLTLTDNTKKISATNIEMEELTTPNTFLNITGTISQTGNQYYIGNTATPANNFRINMLGTSTELRGSGGDVFLRSATDKVVVQGTELEAQCPISTTDTTPSTNPITGSIQTYGGLGVVGQINNGDGITTDGDLTAIGDVNIGGNLTVNGEVNVGLVPAATAPSDANGIYSASTTFDVNFPWLVFDQNDSTIWRSGVGTYPPPLGDYDGVIETIVDSVSQLGEWLQIEFNSTIETGRVDMNAPITKAPLSWVLAGSLDNITWFSLRDETNVQITPTLTTFNFTERTVKYIRLIIRSTNTNPNTSTAIMTSINVYRPFNFGYTGDINCGGDLDVLGNSDVKGDMYRDGILGYLPITKGSLNYFATNEKFNALTTGANNTAVGYPNCGGLTAGNRNSSMGSYATWSLTSGNDNTAIGYNTMANTDSGNGNVAIGSNALVVNALNNQIAIGFNSATTTANQCIIGNSSITEISNAGNGVCDLGAPTRKFKDIYASGNITGDNGSAWGFYEDNGANYSLTINAVTTATLPNNALSSITNISQLPSNGYNFYDSSANKFVPELVGDSYTLGIRITASSSSVTGSAELRLNIGAGTIILNLGVINFPKGSGVSTNFDRTTSVFTLATFVANGAVVELTSLVGDTTITSIGFHIVRTHRAR